jgi:hypothetical protein
MDDTLLKAWTNTTSPFDGEALCLRDLVPIERLSQLLSVTVGALRVEFGDSILAVNSDWHEHDGYVSPSEPTDWEFLGELAASPTALYDHRPGDDFVRLAFFDSRCRFLLRIWIPDENDDPDQYPGKWGTFDLSSSATVIQTITQLLPTAELAVCDAKSFFSKRYAG